MTLMAQVRKIVPPGLGAYLSMWAALFAVAVAAGAASGRALAFAAALLFATGAAHSIAGERFVLMRLFRRADMPRLLGSASLTRQTLRFVWHELTVAMWAAGALLLAVADGAVSARDVARIVSLALAANAAMSLVASRGRHLSWAAFAAAAAAAWIGAR